MMIITFLAILTFVYLIEVMIVTLILNVYTGTSWGESWTWAWSKPWLPAAMTVGTMLSGVF